MISSNDCGSSTAACASSTCSAAAIAVSTTVVVSLLHPRKDGAVRLQIDQTPCARNRRMIRRGFVHGEPQKTADGERVGRAPRDPAFAIDPFKVADQQQPEVTTRRQTRAAHDP